MKYLLPILAFLVFASCKNEANKGEEKSMTSEEAPMETKVPTYDLAKTTLTWTAFKTPAKAGVKGTFDDISLDGNSFSINTASVNTGEPNIRDPKLVQFFFNKLSNTTISGNYGAPVGNKMPITIKMNGVEKTFDFKYELNDTATVVSGTIDIINDFSGSDALTSINEACKELHEGKTWSDVDIQIVSLK